MKRKGKRGDVKLETPVQNSRVLRLHTDKTALLSLVREAWQGSTQGHHLQILTPCSVCPRASQPVAGILPFFHELQGSIGCQAGSGSASTSQEQSGPPTVSQKSDLPGRGVQSLPISAAGVRTSSQTLRKIQFP